MRKILDYTGVVLLCLVVFVVAGGAFYACEIVPLDECMNRGHSFAYCYKLLNR